MLTALIVVLRSIGLICRGHRAVALENIALRQQLAALTRTTKRPRLRPCDRFFWIVLARAWRGWRGALLMAQADTVVRWPRQWLRRRWTERSRQKQSGRQRTDAAIRALIDKMASADPLWGAPRIHGELRKLGIDVSERTVSRIVARFRDRHPRRGAPSSQITSPRSSQWTSSPCPRSRATCCSCWSSSRTDVVESSTWPSLNIQPLNGPRNRSSRRFRNTPRRPGSCETAMRSTVRYTSVASPAWASQRSSRLRRVRGRIHTSNA